MTSISGSGVHGAVADTDRFPASKAGAKGYHTQLSIKNDVIASIAAAIAGPVYATTAAGIAATTNGQYFLVAGDGTTTYMLLYKNVATVATLISSYPSKTAFDAYNLILNDLAFINGFSVSSFKITEASGSVSPTFYRAYVFAIGTVVEQVTIAKAGERTLLQHLSNTYTSNFNLSDGTVSGSGASFSSNVMTHLGGGWYECKTIINPAASTSANAQTRFSAAGAFPYTGDGTSGLYVTSNVMRLQGTTINLWPSSDPTNAAFTKTNCTAAAANAPDTRFLPSMQTLVNAIDVTVNGQLIADKLIEQSGSGSPAWYQSIALVSGNTFVLDVIAKKKERTRLNLFTNGANAFDCTFDLDAGTCSGSGAGFGTVSILSLGAGYYRCRVTGTAVSTTTTNVQLRVFPAAGGHPYTGDGTSGLIVYSASYKINGGANIFAAPTDLSSASWTKASGVTTSANSETYLGALAPGAASNGTYDDGSTALVSKKWTALGSSITAQGFYTGPLATKTGMTLTNAGVSGAAIATSNTGFPSLGIYNAIATIPVDSELVTIEAGINDFGAQECTLGALNDTTTSTFYGALFAAVGAIRTRAPSAKIAFITPYSGGPSHATHKILRVNGQGNTLDQFQKAVRDVAKLTGWPVIDVGGASGIGYSTADAIPYTSDGLHINSVGGDRHASFDAERLRSLSRAKFFSA